MRPIHWNSRKEIYPLKISSFALKSGGLLDDVSHPNTEQYPNQRVFIVSIDDFPVSFLMLKKR